MIEIGKKYNRLTVISDSFERYKRNIIYICKCDCGNEIKVRGGAITSGNTKSCGCLHKELAKKLQHETCFTHGKTLDKACNSKRSSIHESWRKIRIGCVRKALKIRKYSTKVCQEYDKRWDKFENFYQDFGDIKQEQTISRINNQLPWSKENCFVNIGRRIIT